jgi:AraC-like DNA-binding protein
MVVERRLSSKAAEHEPGGNRVPMAFIRALLVRAQECDRDVDAILRAAGFPFDPLREHRRVPFVSREQYSRLCIALFRELGDESGGSMPDVPTPVGATRLIALSMLNCPNLEAAMRRAIEFNACCRLRPDIPVVNTLEIDPATKSATLTYHVVGSDPARQHTALCGLAMWLRLCGWLVGQHIDIQQARCAGPRPRFIAPLRHFFPCPVAYAAPVNSVTFSARHLEADLIRNEAQLNDFMRLAPYHVVIEPVAGERSITHRIREILGEDFREEMPSFDQLTRRLNMSARTLRRRLEKEGTSYQRIKDNARRDQAITLLSRHGMTVSDVAEQLGFSDPSAFHRSFKKWTGQSPGSYR